MIIVLGPEAISELCLKQHHSFSHSKTIELLAEAGLVSSQIIFTGVHPGTVAKISTSLWEGCLELVRDIGQHTPTLNISQWSSRSILELSGTCVFGQESDWLSRYPCLLGSLDRRVANGQVKKAVLSIFPRLIRSLLMLTLCNRKDLADLGYLEYVARDLLQIEKRKLVEPIKPSYTINIISVMLKDGSLTDEEMLGHILIFLAGASETTSATFQWMILELCRHTAVQTKLRDEIQSRGHSLSRSDGGKSLFLQIEAFPYLRAVVDEVLRLHPAVALTEHEATRDTTIMNIPIPKGTLLLCPPLAANLNTRVWGKDATVFNPERWLSRGPASQKSTNQNPCSNMTFSHGPRSCPGQSIARKMLTCLTAAFICQYQVSLENPEQPFASTEAVYVKPIPDLMVQLIEIT
ncbi:cytochrome P450 [Penicillium cosmopolitanum]|uniref:Cytochrome P450 n=1 Tax=Penicillium cosmopolitanum TaxID=1131564 RepID=A0A9W9W4A6_9EURO|nr:cytochrome P450 [Penicillium cosmopolitanum]KAJ5398335.1 cytochrome P450 [Penicillium cosmopolitanum]